jgi:hypothetical protein
MNTKIDFTEEQAFEHLSVLVLHKALSQPSRARCERELTRIQELGLARKFVACLVVQSISKAQKFGQCYVIINSQVVFELGLGLIDPTIWELPYERIWETDGFEDYVPYLDVYAPSLPGLVDCLFREWGSQINSLAAKKYDDTEVSRYQVNGVPLVLKAVEHPAMNCVLDANTSFDHSRNLRELALETLRAWKYSNPDLPPFGSLIYIEEQGMRELVRCTGFSMSKAAVWRRSLWGKRCTPEVIESLIGELPDRAAGEWLIKPTQWLLPEAYWLHQAAMNVMIS